MRTSTLRSTFLCGFSLAAFVLSVPAAGQAQEQAMPVEGDGQNEAHSGVTDDRRTIVVIGERVIVSTLADVEPEQTYDEDAVSSYDVGTLGELLGEIQNENGDDEPAVLVNGRPVRDLGDVANLPVEALLRVEALPRGSAQRIGGPTGQRAYNIVLKPSVKSATVTLSRQQATEGDWGQNRQEVLLNYIKQQDRLSLTLRHSDSDMLLEADRGIVPRTESYPYSTFGNVIPFSGTEVDPALSALAGKPIAVIGLNGTGVPTLATLLAGANLSNPSEATRYRTLRNATDNYEVAVAGNKALAPGLSLSFNGRLAWNRTSGLRGLPSGRLFVPSANAFTPFSTPVFLALNDPTRPLGSNNSTNTKSLAATLNGSLGTWSATLVGRYDQRDATYESQLNGSFAGGFATVDAATNPFDGKLASLLPVTRRISTSTNIEREISFEAQGPLFKLPAGMAQARLGASVSWTSFNGMDSVSTRSFDRRELVANAGVTVPLTSEAFLPGFGASELALDVGRLDAGRYGSVDRSAIALNWSPFRWLRVSISQTKDGTTIYPELLAAPVVVIDNIPYFDPLRNETANVRLITGGNPNLESQTQRIRALSLTASPLNKYNLRLSADYQEQELRDQIGALPSPSSAVVLAFPERFVRDGDGRLVQVDTSPVNFARQTTKQLRLGINFRVPLSPARILPKTATASRRRIPATTLQVNLSHTIILDSTTVIRAGLPQVDLLDGGAIGISGGQQRHSSNATVALTRGATGIRLNAAWRGPSYLQTGTMAAPDRLTFGALFKVDVRLFADLGALFPRSQFANGTRLTMAVENVSNQRQRVFDSFGSVPLSYQPGYRDPVGRTVMLELRKVF